MTGRSNVSVCVSLSLHSLPSSWVVRKNNGSKYASRSMASIYHASDHLAGTGAAVAGATAAAAWLDAKYHLRKDLATWQENRKVRHCRASENIPLTIVDQEDCRKSWYVLCSDCTAGDDVSDILQPKKIVVRCGTSSKSKHYLSKMRNAYGTERHHLSSQLFSRGHKRTSNVVDTVNSFSAAA